MPDIEAALGAMRRPSLLIRAARFGLSSYDRTSVLKRIFGLSIPTSGRSCLRHLIEIESTLDTARREGDATYSVTRHIEVLVAIMAESRMLANGRNQPKASAISDFRRETYSLSRP